MALNLLRWNWTSTKGADPAILWQSSCHNLISGSTVPSTNQTHPMEISLCPGWPCWKRRSNCPLCSDWGHGGRNTHKATRERPTLKVHKSHGTMVTLEWEWQYSTVNYTVVPVVPRSHLGSTISEPLLSLPHPSELRRTRGISAMTGTASRKFSHPSELGTIGSTLTIWPFHMFA